MFRAASLVAQWQRIFLPSRRQGFDSRVRRSSGEANGNPLQYSCVENLKDRGAWKAKVRGVTKS